MKIIDIAKICHQANKAYCEAIGDTTQVDWEQAPEWQRSSAIQGVKFVLSNLDAPPSANHESWMAQKLKDGWTYGPIKDTEKKLHPCIVPFTALPAKQQGKDYLFRHIVISIYHAALVEPES